MKGLLWLVLAASLLACSPMPCPDRDKDGGIGGTGGCTPDTTQPQE